MRSVVSVTDFELFSLSLSLADESAQVSAVNVPFLGGGNALGRRDRQAMGYVPSKSPDKTSHSSSKAFRTRRFRRLQIATAWSAELRAQRGGLALLDAVARDALGRWSTSRIRRVANF